MITSINSASRQPLEEPRESCLPMPSSDCVCGDGSEIDAGPKGWQVVCRCGRSGPWCATEAGAVEAWDDDMFAIQDFRESYG
jgi:hypothetical protein